MDHTRRSSNLLPGGELYGNESMTNGRSSGDPRLSLQEQQHNNNISAGRLSRLRRRASGLDLLQPAAGDMIPVTPRFNTLTRQQSERGGMVRRRESVRRLQRLQFTTTQHNLSRSQTEIPRRNNYALERTRSSSPIRWSHINNNLRSLGASESLPSHSQSREASNTVLGEQQSTFTTLSGWRRFSSSIVARMWGRSESNNSNEQQQQQPEEQQQQQSFDRFQDCLEGPSEATSPGSVIVGESSSSSNVLVRSPQQIRAPTAITTSPQSSIGGEEDTTEEATIPINDVSPTTGDDARPPAHQEDDDEDPESLLCPICRDVLNSVAVTVCGHTFCYPCISQYVAVSPDCPICRSRLTQQQILPNYQFSDLVDLYKDEKKRGSSQNLLRSIQTEPKRNNAVLLENILKDLPYKDALALLQPAVERKKQQEVDRKVAETLLLEEFLSKLKDRHKNTIHELQSQIKAIETDLERAKDKRNVVYMEDVGSGVSSNNKDDDNKNLFATDPLISGSEDARIADDSSNNDHTSAGDSKRRAGHKRKIQESLGLGEDGNPDDSVNQIKRQRLYERFESLQELYLKEACATPGSELPAHYDLGKLSSLLYETTRFNSFRVLDTLFHNDSTSSSIISSIEFDRDDEFFAIAGVSREIKLFDASMIADAISMQYDTNMDSNNDIWPRGKRDVRGSGFIGQFQPSQLVHCPVKVIPAGQKISCLSWNMYVKSHIASSDYEGTIRVWDVNEGQPIRIFDEHERRTWSVDMCAANPTYLASGGDDSTVKIWSTSMAHSVMTLRFNGNVCCAKFAPNVANYLAVGTADHNVTCYDLRYTATPVQSFNGHKKAVSYVRWIDDNQIISASTDNTLRRWNSSNGESQLIYSGHTNEKNFVGLSVNKDWISCGSEDNTVYAYHKDCNTPIVKYRFPPAPMPFHDPHYTQENDQLSSGFVSSTCWKSNTNTLLAANSKGIIKVLQMIP
ncbi:WD40-repeat-containing domain protein [Circinella umbellata]|nr:WD40-repeat-containing domain protein [Circinella umbellata]